MLNLLDSFDSFVENSFGRGKSPFCLVKIEFDQDIFCKNKDLYNWKKNF